MKKPIVLTEKKKEQLIQAALSAAASVDDLFFQDTRSPIAVNKGEKDFATIADFEAHERLTKLLSALIPGVPVLSEEAPEEERQSILEESLFWVIDPIDGTLNFSMGSPLCGLTIALVQDGETLLGVLRFPRLNEEYWAIKGGGSFYNGKRLDLTNDPGKAGEHIICHGVLPSPEGSISQRELASAFLSTQSIGSSALALAWSARGIYGGCLFRHNNAWDMQAGALIVKEAGGEVMDWRSQSYHLKSKTIVAGSSACVREVLNIFEKNNPEIAAQEVLSRSSRLC